jgi:hypothetical protein
MRAHRALTAWALVHARRDRGVNGLANVRRNLCFAACLWVTAHAVAQGTDAASKLKLQQLMEQSRQRVTNSAPNSTGTTTTQSLPNAARMQERTQLLAHGEAALARSDTDTALNAFESAANILHSADTEMGLVRSYMQTGQYRRALAFGAHTAGAHLDEVGGSALYAWLLHIGGQPVFAQRLLAQAQTRVPGHPLLTAVGRQLQTSAPLATGAMLQTPVRMAPYGPRTGMPAHAHVVSSGVLIDNGQRALVPIASMDASPKLWVRNGLGQLSVARIERKLTGLQLAVLRLSTPLPMDEAFTLAPSNAFPGSIAYAVEYVPSNDATPRWPVLHTGFVGDAVDKGQGRQLNISLPQHPRGGPVLDAAGQLIGVAIRNGNASDQIVLTSQLYERLGNGLGPMPQASAERQRASVDQIYEAALRSSLQVIGIK